MPEQFNHLQEALKTFHGVYKKGEKMNHSMSNYQQALLLSALYKIASNILPA
jgi:hypothetical protein